MGILTEWEEQLNGGKQTIESGPGVLCELEYIIPAPFDFRIPLMGWVAAQIMGMPRDIFETSRTLRFNSGRLIC